MFAESAQLLLSFSLILCITYGSKALWITSSTKEEGILKEINRSISKISFFIGFLLLTCFLFLMQLFVVSDFSVLLVAKNSNALLPLEYKIAATWGSHEGSFLLWILMLSGWTCAFAKFHNDILKFI